jgi:hypothetical protein
MSLEGRKVDGHVHNSESKHLEMNCTSYVCQNYALREATLEHSSLLKYEN